MAVDWMQEFTSDVNEQNQRKRQLSDEERKRQRDTFEAASHNINNTICLMLDPETMQPVKGKEAQVAQLRAEMQKINGHLEKFSNPKFNPQTGMVNEDP